MKTQNAKKLNIKQCSRIIERDGLNSDGTETYDLEEVKARLIYLQSRQSEKKVNALVRLYEEGLDAMMDWQNEPSDFWIVDGEPMLIPSRIMPF